MDRRCASEATQLLEAWAPRIAAAGYAEVGEARLRLGELTKAEEAFDLADGLGHDPEPGRSLLLLARGKPAAALASIRRALTDELRALHGRDGLPILIDQEGGRVARLQPPVWPAWVTFSLSRAQSGSQTTESGGSFSLGLRRLTKEPK